MEKIILCRTAWMKYYEGRANIDIPRSGAKYIKQYGTGGEIYNFMNRAGKVYGHFPYITCPNLINLDDQYNGGNIKNVTVVFCATHPTERGIRVVGWYKNAILYGEHQSNSFGDWIHVEAKAGNVHLIPENDRIFELPNTFGRSSLFYFSLHREKKKKALLNQLKKYIANNGKVINAKRKIKMSYQIGTAFQPDITKRLLVEQKAIDLAKEYYGNRYGGNKKVISIESEKKGWDLEIKRKNIKLKVEVKGLSDSILHVELTPNEFKAFNKCSTNYHLFVASSVLTRKPIVRVFKYQSKGKVWIANDKSVLQTMIRRSAILCLES
jgi:hypothetical protein